VEAEQAKTFLGGLCLMFLFFAFLYSLGRANEERRANQRDTKSSRD
jgi:hypothetical protein